MLLDISPKKKKKKKNKPEKIDYHQLRFETLSELKLLDVYGIKVLGEEDVYSPEQLQFMKETEAANRERNALLLKMQPDAQLINNRIGFNQVQKEFEENPVCNTLIEYIEWHRQLEDTIDNMAAYESLFYFDSLVANRLGLVDMNNIHEMSMLKQLEIEMSDRFYAEEDLQDDIRLPGTFDGVAGRRSVIDTLVSGMSER